MIWCVEDDTSIREIELYALSSTGFEARGFEDGASFWAALQSEKPELVLLDVMLPGDDGVSLLKRMKASPDFREIPVIMATAKGAEYDKIRGLDLGAADAVKGDLQRLHIPADRLHGLLLEHPGKQPHQLLLALSGETVFGRLLAGGTLGGVLLGGCLVQFESGAPRGQGGILVREIDLYIGRSLVLIGFRLHRLRHGFDPGTFGTRLRRVGLGLRRCGQFGLYGISSRFGSSLHILSHGADLLLGSRKVRFFSSHLSTRF